MADKSFNVDKYSQAASQGLVDGSDALAQNGGLVLSFYHLPSKKSVYFKAFITAFNETWNSDWAAETVYGRIDPIYMFKNTIRKISLAFKVPAATEGEAYENLAKVQAVTQFLYPAYTDVNKAQTIAQSPLIRIKVMNLLQKTQDSDSTASTADSAKKIAAAYGFGSAADQGLLGVIDSFTVNHNLENTDYGVVEVQSGTILPKLIEVNLGFSVIHEISTGWEAATEAEGVNHGEVYGAPQANPEVIEAEAAARAAARAEAAARAAAEAADGVILTAVNAAIAMTEGEAQPTVSAEGEDAALSEEVAELTSFFRARSELSEALGDLNVSTPKK